jgi:hypothetical protein
MDEKQIQELILNTPPEQLAKAVKEAMGLGGIRIIKDLWEDYHAIPDRSETKTGPSMHSSGSGAEKALDQYSNPAPQISITEQYDKFTQQNIENFKHLEGSMKSLADEFKSIAGIVADLVKAKEEKKEEEKKEEMKSDTSAKLASYWDKLGELEQAFAKAEDESKDIAGLEAARELIEKAEKHLEEVEAHEKEEEKEHSAMKALTSINLAWRSLYKATGLSSYDLHGYGNQKDEAVTGDENADAANKDFKAEGKAFYYALKAKHEKDEKEKKKAMYCAKFNEGEAEKFASAFENFTKAGLEQAEPVSKSKHMKLRKALKKYASKLGKSQLIGTTPAEAAGKAADVTSTVANPEVTAQVEAIKADFDAKSKELEKSFKERVDLLNSRINEVTGGKAPGMVPVILKSGGIKSDNVAQIMNDKIDKAVENAEMSDEHASIARGLVARYQAAGKGSISTQIVNRQLELAPAEVQSFFQRVEATA